jgi:hypothetical protein
MESSCLGSIKNVKFVRLCPDADNAALPFSTCACFKVFNNAKFNFWGCEEENVPTLTMQRFFVRFVSGGFVFLTKKWQRLGRHLLAGLMYVCGGLNPDMTS